MASSFAHAGSCYLRSCAVIRGCLRRFRSIPCAKEFWLFRHSVAVLAGPGPTTCCSYVFVSRGRGKDHFSGRLFLKVFSAEIRKGDLKRTVC